VTKLNSTIKSTYCTSAVWSKSTTHSKTKLFTKLSSAVQNTNHRTH